MTTIPTNKLEAATSITESIIEMLSKNGRTPTVKEAQSMAAKICQGTSESWAELIKLQVSLLVLEG